MKEAFTLDQGKLKFDQNNPSYRYYDNLMDFQKAETPQGNPMLTLAEVPYTEDIKAVLYALKNGVDSEELTKFLDFIGGRVSTILKHYGAHYVLQVPSSSKFLKATVSQLIQRHLLPPVDFVKIQKNPIDMVRFNKRSPHLSGMDRDEVGMLRDKVMHYLQLQIKDGEESLVAKRFPKTLLPLLTGFFTTSIDGNKSVLAGKTVVLLDDNISTGTTLTDIVDSFSRDYQTKTVGLTLFKIVQA